MSSLTTPDTTPYWNPSDPAFRADPYPYYDVLRSQAPAFKVDDYLVLTRYTDVAATLRSPEVSRDTIDQVDWDISDPVQQRRQRQRMAKTILHLDPPDHTRLRRLVTAAFTPRSVAALEERIIAMTDAALDRAAATGHIELIDEMAYPIPLNVISELLGVPTDRSDEIRSLSRTLTAALEPNATVEDLDAAEVALFQLLPFLVGVVNERRASPQDDLLSALLAVEDDGDTLSAEELMSFAILLYVAGHETTVNLIGNGMLALLRHPDQLDRWRNDDSLDRHAVDELLRFDGPVQHTIRAPLVPMEFDDGHGGTVIAPARRPVLCVLGAANRDPDHFPDPNTLQLDRPHAATHMSFGSGIHHCLGAPLARLEATTILTRLIRRFSSIELTEEPEWRDRITIRGLATLPLRVTV